MPVESRTALKVLGASAPRIDPSAGTENAVLTNLRDSNRALDHLRRALESDEQRGEELLHTDRLV